MSCWAHNCYDATAEEAIVFGNNNNSGTMCWIICAPIVFLVWWHPGEVRTGRAAQSHVLSTWAGLTHLYANSLFWEKKGTAIYSCIRNTSHTDNSGGQTCITSCWTFTQSALFSNPCGDAVTHQWPVIFSLFCFPCCSLNVSSWIWPHLRHSTRLRKNNPGIVTPTSF